MVRTRLNIGCRYSTPVRERPLHPTRGHFTPEPSQTQAPVTPATEPERRAGGSLTMKASSFVISRLRDASSPAVYASRRALPHAMQDSLPAGGLRLCRAGVEPAESLREVSAHVILLSRASPGAISVHYDSGGRLADVGCRGEAGRGERRVGWSPSPAAERGAEASDRVRRPMSRGSRCRWSPSATT